MAYTQTSYPDGRVTYNDPNGERAANARKGRNHRRLLNIGKAATVLGGSAGIWAPAILGGSAAAAGGAAASAGAGGPVAAGASRAAGVPWMRLAEIGANVGSSLWGNRKAGQADQRAMAFEERANAENMAFLREQEARRQREWEAIYGPEGSERRSFDADQEQNRLDRAASDEERTFERQKYTDREGRRGPYRQVSQQALMSLANVGRR